jgi:hypothetical protein
MAVVESKRTHNAIHYTVATLVLLGVLAALRGQGYQSEPKQISREETQRRIEVLPKYTHFGLSGVAFYKGKLYASSNVGLLLVTGDTLEGALQWFPDDDVIGGPFSDPGRDALWIKHSHTNLLWRLDAAGWHREGLPSPPTGRYTRGDVMEGFSGMSDAREFWLVGAGHAWRWLPQGAWALEPQPPTPQFSTVRGVARVAGSLLYVVREGIPFFPAHPTSAVYNRERAWERIPLKKMEVKQIVVANNVAFVRSEEGDLFQLTDGAATPLMTAGPCEAITRASDGSLLASFRGRGIYALAGSAWQFKMADPFGPEESQHWAYLAEAAGRIAYATSSMPHLDSIPQLDSISRSGPPEWRYSGSDSLWISGSGSLRRVRLH